MNSFVAKHSLVLTSCRPEGLNDLSGHLRDLHSVTGIYYNCVREKSKEL